MLKAIARIQTAVAIAQGNGDTAALSAFQAAIAAITPFAVPPYILPDVLTPADVAPPTGVEVATGMTIAEAHDAVQAGVITRQDAVDAGVIQTVDAIPPHPDETPAPTNAEVGPLPLPLSNTPAPDAPANSVPEQVTPDVPNGSGNMAGTQVDGAAGQPQDTTPDPVVPVPVTPPPAEVASAGTADTPVPEAGPVVLNQADTGDEDPTPPEKETIASLDARLDKIERPGKVSRQ